MKKKILVTSALPYVNNVPHLGTLICIISSDVYSRFLRMKGENVLYVCGTDEHGTTTEAKALEEGLTPKEITDKYFRIHKEIYDWFNCRFDCFGRTSSRENHAITREIFSKLDKNGYISEGVVEQAYCESCRKFLADRFVEGECPYCGYKDARGDQCEQCGKLLEPTELKNARCKTCGNAPAVKESRHLFIDLPKLSGRLKKWIEGSKKKWSENAVTMTEAWLKEGLKPRCITRDLKWGIPVPKKGYEDKVFYSWFDAPIGYIGITIESRKDWQKWWKSPKKVSLVQFMGKDNIPFHTILFPAFLIGTGENYTLLDSLSVNEYLNYETGKFSKSRNEGVFGDSAVKTGIPADAYRYYLMTNRPERQDTVFEWQDFQAKINNELVANLGNLVNRIATFISRFFDSKVPKGKEDKRLWNQVRKEEKKLTEMMGRISIKDALRQLMIISRIGNQYFQEKEPWKTKETNALYNLVNLVKELAIMAEPFMPATAGNIRRQLNIEEQKWSNLGKLSIKASHKIGKPELLFRKLEDDEVKRFREEFSGKGKQEKFLLDLRVAEIINAEEHPEADKLVVLQIGLGKEKRQIVAGIRQYYDIGNLVGKRIIVVANLKKAVLRGKESNGMLLAADDGKPIVLEAQASKPGDAAFFEGMQNEAKEIGFEEFKRIQMNVVGKRVVFGNKALRTASEEINVNAKDGATIK